MENIGRDKNVQLGIKNRLKIDNRQNQDGSWMGKLVLGVLIIVIAAGILYWFGWNS